MNTKNKEDILKAYTKYRTYQRFVSMAADLDAKLDAPTSELEYLHGRIEYRADIASDHIEDLNARDQVILFRYHAIKHGYSIEL